MSSTGQGNNNPINYKQIFEESPAPKYIFDLDSLEFLAVNDAALAQYGYTREEFLSMKVTEIRPADDVAALQQVLDDIPGTTYFNYGHWRHKRKNGEVFYVHIYAHKTDFQNRRARFVMALDIDRKVKAENELIEKNEEITDILESITDGFYAVNSRWEVTYINKEAERILNCKRDELLGKRIWEFFPSAGSDTFYNEYQRVMTKRECAHFEEYYAPFGIWVSVWAYPTRDGLAVYFMDITEQKKMREKLVAEEQNLRAIINNTSNIIYSIDKNYNVISANEAFYERMKRITGKHITKMAIEYFDPEPHKIWMTNYQRALAGETFTWIWSDQRKDISIYEEVSFNPITNGDNEIIGVSCFCKDITESYLYTKKIEAQNEQLRNIAWMQSHEVRGPLSDIMGLTSLINNDITDKAQKAELTLLIQQAANKLDQVINRIVEETARKKETNLPPI